MLVGGDLASQGFTMLGVASDSILEVIVIAGVIAFLVFVFGFVVESRNESPRPGIFKRKPLLFPALAFVIAALLVITLVPTPMSQYQGDNSTQFYLTIDDTMNFNIYPGEFYHPVITLRAECSLKINESLQIKLDVYSDGVLTKSASLNLTGFSDQYSTINGQVEVPLEPGQYKITLTPSYNFKQNQGDTIVPQCTLEQSLVSGMFNEVLSWSSYLFILEVSCALLLIAGICVGKEDKERISREKVDQEPPKDGAAYARWWV
jgi:amino acid transporter